MKAIAFRGGLVTFDIPDDWVEDVDLDDESGLYYEDVEDAGILRLSVITATNPNPVTADLLAQTMDKMSSAKNKKLETLPNGNVLLSYTTKTREEDGRLLILYFWHVGQPVSPNRARIANFSYTVLAANALSTKTQNAVTQLEKTVRNAAFAQEDDV